MLQQKVDFQGQYTEIARQQHQATLSLQHDLKHILSVLSVLIESNELDKAEKLIGEYMQENAHSVVLIDTTNESLNAIISLKLTYANYVGIKTFCAVPESFSLLNDAEISSLFGNMLDNAIEYCEKHLDKENEISVTIISENMKTTILVKNRLHNSVFTTDRGLETDKNDKTWFWA